MWLIYKTMKRFNFKMAAVATMIAGGLASMDAHAAGFDFNDNAYVSKMRQEVKSVRPFRGQKPWGVATAGLDAKFGGKQQRAAVTSPSKEFEGLSYYDFLDAPDGTVWFYTTEYDIESVEVSEWYTEDQVVGYTFTIYDSSFKEVGQVKDKITFGAGETRVASAVLDPALSAKFFNTDGHYEVMVYLAMNTGYELGYEVHYYNKVYSIGGEKDAEGNDVCIATIPGRCVDVFNAAADSGAENCFYTFVDDIYPDPSDFGTDQYLDYINAVKTHVSVYSKAEANGGPALVMEKDIFMTRYPGDTTDGIYFITKNVNGTPYFIFSQYEKPYFVDPTGYATDENATEDNSFVIEVYSYGNAINEISTTKIPVEIKKVAGEINYTFYSIGSVAWKEDIDMSVNGTPQAPAFLVARDFTKASNLEEVASSYDIYGNNGQLLHNLTEDANGIILLSSIAGEQPQAMFVGANDDGDYVFNFIDLYSGQKVLALPYIFNGKENDQLTASCERVKAGNGAYQYVFEMRYDETDEEGNDVKRVAWFNKDGSLARIDKVNMGKNVMAASVNMFPESLSPHLYDTDDAMEYAVLVKRYSEETQTTRNEFIVVDDNGEWYATFSEADGKGSPMTFSIIPGIDGNYLQMVYLTNDYTYNVEVYDLPFVGNVSTSVEKAMAGNASAAISLNGTTVSASGAHIEVYTTAGMKVAEGQNVVSLQSLVRGTYIAVARDQQGNSTTMKIAL